VVSSIQVSLDKSYAFLISPMRTTCPAYLIFLDFITVINFGEALKL
jgi:hypothetical protein